MGEKVKQMVRFYVPSQLQLISTGANDFAASTIPYLHTSITSPFLVAL